MSVIPLYVALVATLPPLAEDAPAGCDLLVRVEVGKLANLEATRENLRAFGQFEPGLGPLLDGASQAWKTVAERVTEAAKVNLSGDRLVVTIAVDLDTGGPPVVSAVVRGMSPATELPVEVDGPAPGEEPGAVQEPGASQERDFEEYLVDEHLVFRHGDLHWARVGDALVMGDTRGLQRQLRRALGRSEAPEELVRAAQRVRQQAPVMVALAPSLAVKKELARGLGDVGTFVQEIDAVNISATEKRLLVQVQTGSEEERTLVAHGARALVATIAATEQLMIAGAQMVLGLTAAGKSSKMFPADDDALGLSWALESWLDEPVIRATISERRNDIVEIDAKIDRVEGLVAVLAVLLAHSGAHPFASDAVRDEAQTLLEELRERQFDHRKAAGKFVECGPTPRQVPRRPVAWPSDSCFDQLDFAPDGPVRVQLQVTVQGGRLLMIARADPDGDGVPLVWYLDESAKEIRGFSGEGAP